MAKKLVALATALTALAALVAPAAASATPVLTLNGVAVPANTAIKGKANNTNLRLTTETGLGVLECESILLNGKVTENSGTSIKGEGTAGSGTSGCSFEGVEEAEVTNIVLTDLASNMVEGETGTGAFHVSYASKIPGGAECKFSNVGKTAGVFHYTLGTDILHITPTNVTSTGCGESFLEGTVTLQSGGGPLVLTSGGAEVPPGTAITGTANDSNLRLTTETFLGELECESILLNGKVTENSGASIKGVGTEGSFTEGCSFEGVQEAEITNIKIDDIASNKVEGETGTGTFHASYAVNIGAVCKFSNVGKTAGVFHYTLGSDILHITRTNVSGSGCGEAFLEGTVKLETTNSTPVSAAAANGTPVTVS